MIPNPNQADMFRRRDATGALKPKTLNNEPFQHQRTRSNASSAIALDSYAHSGALKIDKELIKEDLFKNPASTLSEISARTGIVQHGTITGRFENLREDGYDLLNDCGRWTIVKRNLK